MKKKILLIIALGISFAPVAFAGDTGEEKQSEVAVQGRRCEGDKDLSTILGSKESPKGVKTSSSAE